MSQVLGPVLEKFHMKSDEVAAELALQSASASSSVPAGPEQVYSRMGYNVIFGICVGCQALSLLVILFVNTGRGRRSQEAYMRELDEKQDETKPLVTVGNEASFNSTP